MLLLVLKALSKFCFLKSFVIWVTSLPTQVNVLPTLLSFFADVVSGCVSLILYLLLYCLLNTVSTLTGMGYAVYDFYLFSLPVDGDGFVIHLFNINLIPESFVFVRGDKSHNKLSS